MRLFPQFAPRAAQTPALLLLSLTLAGPVSSQTTAPDDTIQVIAQQQKLISQTSRLERSSEWVMHLKTLALLAAYGGWTIADTTKGYTENLLLLEYVEQVKPELLYAKKAAEHNKSVPEEELKQFSGIYSNVETLLAVAVDVHDLLESGKIGEANALYRDKSVPLIRAINADSYTLISSLEKKIDKAALQARLAK